MISSHSHQLSMRSASSVAEELGLPLYRLRSWESLYPVFKTEQGDGGERYYDAHAVEVVRNISRLLYQEGVKSHEVVPRLRQAGLTEPPPVKAVSQQGEEAGREGDEAGEAADALLPQLRELREENTRLNDRLEEFGHIALSLKTLEDENATLKAALEQARSAAAGDSDKAGYLDELETRLLTLEDLTERQEKELEEQRDKLAAREGQRPELEALKAKLSELEADQTRFVAQREAFAAERAEAARQHEALQAENKALRDARLSKEDADASQKDRLAAQIEDLESERRNIVQKLEQSVLIMQSLEDENLRLKRSLEECEVAEREQRAQAEQLKVLKAENTELKQVQTDAAEERERHARGLERIRNLEADLANVRQKLAVRDEQNRSQADRQKGLRQCLEGVLGELAQMKKTLTD